MWKKLESDFILKNFLQTEANKLVEKLKKKYFQSFSRKNHA